MEKEIFLSINQIQNQYSNEIQIIEEWSFTKYKEMIFDSEIHNWSKNTSEFDRIIFGKEKLIFLIEDTENNLFGCYIDSKIDKYSYYENIFCSYFK